MSGLSFSTLHLPSRRRGRKKAAWLVGEAPADADEVLATVKAPPGWVRVLVVVAATASLWFLIILGGFMAFAHGG